MGTFDFSALGQIGRDVVANLDKGEKDRVRGLIGLGLKDPNADYRALAGQAIEVGDIGLGGTLLDLGTQQQAERANAAGYRDLGSLIGGGGGGGGSGSSAQMPGLGGLVRTPPSSGKEQPAGLVQTNPMPMQGSGSAGAQPQTLASLGSGGGLSPSYLPTVRQIESGGNAQAVSPTGARGPYQFTGATARQYGLTDPTDPVASADATSRLARDNAGALRQRLGRDPTEAEVYLAHQQGAGGASALLSNPNMPAVDALAPAYGGDRAKAARAIQVNGGDPNMPARDFADLWTSKYNRIAGAGQPGAAVTARGGGFERPGAPNILARSPDDVQSAEISTGMVNPDGSYPPIESVGASRQAVPSPSRQDVTQSGVLDGTPAAQPVDPSKPATWQRPSDVPGGYRQVLSRQDAPKLVEIMGRPGVGAGVRELAKTFLATALNDPDSKLPEDVRSYMWAKGNGQTAAKSYDEWRKSKSERDDEGEKIDKQIAARQRGATTVGLDPNSPEGKRYIATGTMPAARDTPMTASDRKSIQDADDAVVSAQNAISAMGEAKRLSGQAYDGPTASIRGKITGMFGDEAGQSTTELNNVVTSNALGQLKSIFGGNPTEGERKILLEIQGSADQPQAVRDRIFDRASALAQRRLETATAKATELRGGSYYKEGGGPTGKQPGRMPETSAAPQARAPGNVSSIPAGAVDMLKSDPSLAAHFDEKYGAGSSRMVLGQ